MYSNAKEIIMRVVDRFARTGEATDDEVKVVCLPDNKTSFVEQNVGGSRSIMLDEYKMNGKVIWAGYSPRLGIVYLSSVAKF
ncbi:MAG: hypothetical protein ACK2T0_05540 [Anaerolineales bacterium]